jgi:hypothetical protein
MAPVSRYLPTARTRSATARDTVSAPGIVPQARAAPDEEVAP